MQMCVFFSCITLLLRGFLGSWWMLLGFFGCSIISDISSASSLSLYPPPPNVPLDMGEGNMKEEEEGKTRLQEEEEEISVTLTTVSHIMGMWTKKAEKCNLETFFGVCVCVEGVASPPPPTLQIDLFVSQLTSSNSSNGSSSSSSSSNNNESGISSLPLLPPFLPTTVGSQLFFL